MVKQVIVVRTDLKMRRGKENAQSAHASICFLTLKIREGKEIAKTLLWKILSLPLRICGYNPIHFEISTEQNEWIEGTFSKICCAVESEEELLEIEARAVVAGLDCNLIIDNGNTEFHGVKTKTCLAIGPNDASKIDPITGHLKLR